VAYINTLVALSLSPAVVAEGSAPGSLVGYLSVSSLLDGQYLPPRYSLTPADEGLFAVGDTAHGRAPLRIQFLASYAGQTYAVVVHVDIGFGDDAAVLVVSVIPSPPPPPGGSGITARLVTRAVGPKKTRLMVELLDAATGEEVAEILSPFQKPAFRRIQVSVINVAGAYLVLTARKGKRRVPP
jgi:hypothetical protein